MGSQALRRGWQAGAAVLMLSIVSFQMGCSCGAETATVIDADPVFGAENVPVDQVVQLIFDREMVADSGSIRASNDAGSLEIEVTWLVGVTGIPNQRLQIEPVNDFGANSEVSIVLAGLVGADMSTLDYTHRFQTGVGCAPDGIGARVTSEASQTLIVPRDTTQVSFDITFDQPLDDETVTLSNVNLTGTGSGQLTQITGADRTWTLTIENIQDEDFYTFLFTNRVRDRCGDAVANDILSLTIDVDPIQPTLVTHSLPSGVVDCGTTSLNVEMSFSEAVTGVAFAPDSLSVSGGLTLENLQGSGPGPYQFTISGLSDGLEAILTLGPAIVDVSGNTLPQAPLQAPILVCSIECALPDYEEQEVLSNDVTCISAGSPGNTNTSTTPEVIASLLDFDIASLNNFSISGQLQSLEGTCLTSADDVYLIENGFTNFDLYNLKVAYRFDGANSASTWGDIAIELLDSSFNVIQDITSIVINPFGTVTEGNVTFPAILYFEENEPLYIRVSGSPDVDPSQQAWLDYCITLDVDRINAVTTCGETCTSACTVDEGEPLANGTLWQFLPFAFNSNDREHPSLGTTGPDAVVRYDKTSDESTFLRVRLDQSAYSDDPLADPIIGIYDACFDGTQVGIVSDSGPTIEIFESLPAGQYFVWVDNEDESGDFRGADLVIEEQTPGPGESCLDANPLTDGANNLALTNNFSSFRLATPSCIAGGNLVWYSYDFDSSSYDALEIELSESFPLAIYEDGVNTRCIADGSEGIVLVNPAESVCMALANLPDYDLTVTPLNLGIRTVGTTTTASNSTGTCGSTGGATDSLMETSYGLNDIVTDVNVFVNLETTWNGEVNLYLEHDDGNDSMCVNLINGVGGSSDNFTATFLDDQASSPLSSGTAPFSGAFQPTPGNLGAFNGRSPNGTWTIWVYDDFCCSDAVTLDSWALQIQATTVGPGESCSTGDALTVGTTNLSTTTNSSTQRVAEPSCIPTGNLVWYNYTAPAGDPSLVKAYTSQAEPMALYNNGAEICTADASEALFAVVEASGELCFALADAPTFDVTLELIPLKQVNATTSLNATTEDCGQPNAITDSIVISSYAPTDTLSDVNVLIDITTSWASDIDLYLEYDDGVTSNCVELMSDVGGSTENFTRTFFDDEAAQAISLGSAPFTGNFQPEAGDLSTFDGMLANGTWTIWMNDDATGDDPTFNYWAIAVSN